MAVLDQITVTVADVIPSAAEGHIVGIEYWNPITGLWQATFPTNVPEGSTIGVRTTFQNDLAYAQNMSIDILVTPPTSAPYTITGAVIAVLASATTEAMSTWTADETGTWQATVTLNGEIA